MVLIFSFLNLTTLRPWPTAVKIRTFEIVCTQRVLRCNLNRSLKIVHSSYSQSYFSDMRNTLFKDFFKEIAESTTKRTLKRNVRRTLRHFSVASHSSMFTIHDRFFLPVKTAQTIFF